jgi:4-hydroxy-tetrahydrodipicolinate reductase
MALKILLNGARGKMGLAVAAMAPSMGVTIGAQTDQGDDVATALASVDAVVDFSSHEATRALLELAVSCGKPVVLGTTGHTPEEKDKLLKLAARVPCVWAGNFSIGVNLLFALTRRASRTLGEDYDAEIVELHHRMKKDAPSGTALRLLDIILEERKLDRNAVRHGREGITGERTSSEVGIHSIRGGDVIGDHTVIMAGKGERLELTHRATDRSIYARGALRAAQWVVSRKPGVYDMQDVLELV